MATEPDPGGSSIMASPGNPIRFRGTKYVTINDLINDIQTNFPLDERYTAQCEALEVLTEIQERFEDSFEQFFSYMQASQSFLTTSSEEDFLTNHAETLKAVTKIRKRRDKKAAAINRITASWTTQRGKALVDHLTKKLKLNGEAYLAQLAKIAETVTVEEGVAILNQEMVGRNVTERGPSKKLQKKSLEPADVKKACEAVKKGVRAGALDQAVCTSRGLKMGQLGLLEVDNNQVIELLTFPDDRPFEGHLASSPPAKGAMKDPSIESTARQTQGEGGEGSGANNLEIEGAESRMRPSHPAQKEDSGAASTISAIDNAKTGGTADNSASHSEESRMRPSHPAQREDGGAASTVSAIDNTKNSGTNDPANESSESTESTESRLRLSPNAEEEKVMKIAGIVSGIEILNHEGGSIPTQAQPASITGNESESPEIDLPALPEIHGLRTGHAATKRRHSSSSPGRKKQRTSEQGAGESGRMGVWPPLDSIRRLSRECECDLPENWKSRLEFAEDKPDSESGVAILAQLSLMAAESKPCAFHIRLLSTLLGMLTTNEEETLARLQALQVKIKHGTSIERMRVEMDSFSWFTQTKSQDKLRTENTLGVFKFLPNYGAINGHLQPDIVTIKPFQLQDIDNFREAGFVIHSGLAWWEKTIKDIVLAEFDLHYYHSRVCRPERNDGILHSMIFSISQQLARQDPALYVASVSLRKDKNSRLVSSPRCATYIQQGCGVNAVHTPARSEGNSHVCDEICFDDDEGGERDIIRGFTEDDFEAWHANRKRQQEQDVKVLDQESESLAAFMKGRGLEWEPAAARFGDVIYTASHMPSRLYLEAGQPRRSISVSFVALGDDGESLEDGQSWSEVSLSHSRLKCAPCQETDDAAPHMPFKFGAAVELSGLGYVSDALVGRRDWDSPLVLKERDHILSCSQPVFNAWYGRWKTKAVKLVREAWKAVEERERAVYGERSYFALLDKHPGGLESFPEIDPDNEVFAPERLDLEARGEDKLDVVRKESSPELEGSPEEFAQDWKQ